MINLNANIIGAKFSFKKMLLLVMAVALLFGNVLCATTMDLTNKKEVLIIDKGVRDYQFFVDNANKGTNIILLDYQRWR